jgi:hypothetical protein
VDTDEVLLLEADHLLVDTEQSQPMKAVKVLEVDIVQEHEADDTDEVHLLEEVMMDTVHRNVEDRIADQNAHMTMNNRGR